MSGGTTWGVARHPHPPDWMRDRVAREVKDACRAAAKYCQEAGVSLEKLALAFTLSEPSVPLFGYDGP